MDWVEKLKIKHFRGVYSRDVLPQKIRKECGIINLDDIQGAGTHWVCDRNLDSVVGSLPVVEYFDPFGLVMPYEALEYFRTARKKIVYSIDEIQNRSTVLCGYWCLYYLYERQRGNSILDIIHNPHFDNDNSDFIKEYHSWYFKIVSNFTRLTAREIVYNNFEISLVVFLPNITYKSCYYLFILLPAKVL